MLIQIILKTKKINNIVMQKLRINSNLVINYRIRTEGTAGNEYIIVPVVMMVEGVHNGSEGPVLYTAEELSASASSWNNFPVVVNHPMDSNGDPTSAQLPELIGNIVGRIHNAHMDGSKLKGEVWINVNDLQGISDTALNHIKSQQPLDVSIGAFSDNERVEGEFHNEHYTAIARNVRPDHLALLPGGTGACSWDDGCGIRTNSKEILNKSKSKIKNEVEKHKLTVKEMHGILLKNGFVINELGNSELSLNELGFREISNDLQQKLDTFDGEGKYHYLEEVFDSYFIYAVRSSESRSTKLFKRSYQVVNDQIEILDDAVNVVLEKTYKIAPATVNRVRMKESQVSTKNKNEMSKKVTSCQVDALIANEASQFGADDREFLEGLDEVIFNKMVPKEEKVINKKKEEVPVDQVQLAANAVKSFFADKKTTEDFIGIMPPELQLQMNASLDLQKVHKKKLVDGIVANSEFKAEDLEKWDNATLTTMYASVVPQEVLDFSGIGEMEIVTNDDVNDGEDDELSIMLRLDSEPKKKEA